MAKKALNVGSYLVEDPTRRSRTVLGDFERRVRDEPLWYIYRHKIYVTKDEVPADEVISWLRERYLSSRSGNRYRVVQYSHSNGNKYVDYVLMETCKDVDLTYMMLRWGWSETKVRRGNRIPRKRLTKEQRQQLDNLLRQVRNEFIESL